MQGMLSAATDQHKPPNTATRLGLKETLQTAN